MNFALTENHQQPEPPREADGDTPLVSVIIIFLNALPFLEEAIESVLTQTYTHWELLLVDDGSTDGSTAVARGYAERDPDRVRYLEHAEHENRGASASRNLGIRQARGEYLALMDADDVWLPQKLTEQVAILNSHQQAGMIYGNTLYWHSWTENPDDAELDYLPPLGERLDALIQPPALLDLFLQQKYHVPCPCTVMVRRAVIERVGGFVEDFHGIYQLYEDLVFYAKVCLQEPVYVASDCWAKYRRHPNSCVALARRAGKQQQAQRFFFEWLEQYLTERDGQSTVAWRTLQEKLWPLRHPILHRLKQRFRKLATSVKLLWLQAWIVRVRLKRRVLGHSTGGVAATPNPVRLDEKTGLGSTILSWAADGPMALEVRVNAPDGALLSNTSPAGSMVTGEWVNDGMTFFLQDVSNGLPLTLANTLDLVVIRGAIARHK